MHYRNGREAKNGDKIISIDVSTGQVNAFGVLYSAVAGNDYCNGLIAPVQNPNQYACLADCLHVDDVIEMLKEKGLTDTMYFPVRFPLLHTIAVECNNIDELLIENVLNGHIPTFAGRRIRRNHMSLNTLIELINANDLSKCSKIYLLHLSDHNSNAEQMKLKVQSQTGIPTEIC